MSFTSSEKPEPIPQGGVHANLSSEISLPHLRFVPCVYSKKKPRGNAPGAMTETLSMNQNVCEFAAESITFPVTSTMLFPTVNTAPATGVLLVPTVRRTT